MDLKRIEDLLQKFYNGETNLGEERVLDDFFTSRDVPFHLKTDQEIFNYCRKARIEDLPQPELEEKILNAISRTGGKAGRTGMRKIYLIASIAASLLLLICSYFFFLSPTGPGLMSNRYFDTYENPDLAYLETKKALLYVSEKLNEGTRGLENLTKFEKGTKELNNLKMVVRGTQGVYTFSLFGTGIREMELISTFSRAQELISN